MKTIKKKKSIHNSDQNTLQLTNEQGNSKKISQINSAPTVKQGTSLSHCDDDLVEKQDIYMETCRINLGSTVEDVLSWLEFNEELAQYIPEFTSKKINGAKFSKLTDRKLIQELLVTDSRHLLRIHEHINNMDMFTIPQSSWSADQMLMWLKDDIELSMYAGRFENMDIDGKTFFTFDKCQLKKDLGITNTYHLDKIQRVISAGLLEQKRHVINRKPEEIEKKNVSTGKAEEKSEEKCIKQETIIVSTRYCVLHHRWSHGLEVEEVPKHESPDVIWARRSKLYCSVMFQSHDDGKKLDYI